MVCRLLNCDISQNIFPHLSFRLNGYAPLIYFKLFMTVDMRWKLDIEYVTFSKYHSMISDFRTNLSASLISFECYPDRRSYIRCRFWVPFLHQYFHTFTSAPLIFCGCFPDRRSCRFWVAECGFSKTQMFLLQFSAFHIPLADFGLRKPILFYTLISHIPHSSFHLPRFL